MSKEVVQLTHATLSKQMPSYSQAVSTRARRQGPAAFYSNCCCGEATTRVQSGCPRSRIAWVYSGVLPQVLIQFQPCTKQANGTDLDCHHAASELSSAHASRSQNPKSLHASLLKATPLKDSTLDNHYLTRQVSARR